MKGIGALSPFDLVYFLFFVECEELSVSIYHIDIVVLLVKEAIEWEVLGRTAHLSLVVLAYNFLVSEIVKKVVVCA